MNIGKIFTKNITGWHQYENFAAALLIGVFLILFYRDVVFNGRTFLMETAAEGTMPTKGPFKYEGVTPGFVANDPSAISLQIEPFNRFLSKSVKRGDFPLWNPYTGLAGSPLLADGYTGPLEPLQFLFFFIPDRYWPYAIDTQLLLRFFLAGFSCYLFARRLKIGFLGGVSAGVLFMLSSYFVTHGNHPQVKTETLLPLVLYGYDRLADIEDRPGFWLCALFIGWAIIAAMPESTFFVLFLGTLWYFYKSIFIGKEFHNILKGVKLILIRYARSTALGVLLSAAYLLPFLEYVSLSSSVHATGNGINWGGTTFPLWSIFSLILQTGGKYYIQFGVCALFVLVFSFFRFRGESEFRKATIFFSLYATIFILIMFSFPLTTWVPKIPILNRIVLYRYPVPSIAFCLAILSGIFVDEASTKLSFKKISISLFILPLFLLVLPRLSDPKNFSSHLPGKQVIFIAIYFAVGVFFVLFALTLFIKAGRLNSYPSQIILLLLFIIEPFYWGTQLKRPSRYDPYFQQIPPFIHYLKNDNEIYRISSVSGILYPNISTAYEIFDTRWLDPLVPQRAYDFTVRFVTSEEPKTMRFTGAALPISDRMFDLLNVKYVLGRNSGVCNSSGKINVSQPVFFGQGLDVKQLVIDNSIRNVTLAHPPSKFDMGMSIPEQSSSLDFSIGLNPQVFQPDRGDGVGFTIRVIDNNNRFTLFTKYIDPKNDPCDRKWFDESIPLGQWAGKAITLRFITDAGPKGNTNWDWAYWGDIRLNPAQTLQPSKQMSQQPTAVSAYETVHRDPFVEIFQNKDVYPRAFLVYDLINVHTFNQALDLLANSAIDLRQTAIVENFPDNSKTLIRKNEQKSLAGSANVKYITPDRLSVEVETGSSGFLVVSEQYYPGWRAYIDGKETPVYAVDGILRGVLLSEGKHTVVFEYKPLSFLIGLIVSIICLLVTITGLAYHYKRSTHMKMVVS